MKDTNDMFNTNLRLPHDLNKVLTVQLLFNSNWLNFQFGLNDTTLHIIISLYANYDSSAI